MITFENNDLCGVDLSLDQYDTIVVDEVTIDLYTTLERIEESSFSSHEQEILADFIDRVIRAGFILEEDLSKISEAVKGQEEEDELASISDEDLLAELGRRLNFTRI